MLIACQVLDLVSSTDLVSHPDPTKRGLKQKKGKKNAKNAKKAKNVGNTLFSADNLRGVYFYIGCGLNIFLAKIDCSLDNGDVCVYEETKMGQIFDPAVEGEDKLDDTSVEIVDGYYFNPLFAGVPALDDVCVYSGVFSASTAIKGNGKDQKFKPIALDTSDACDVDENSQFYVKGQQTNDNGDLLLIFSSDGGKTYYNEEKGGYIGYKLNSEAEEAISEYFEENYNDGARRSLFLCFGLCTAAALAIASITAAQIGAGAAVVSAGAAVAGATCKVIDTASF